MLEPMAVKCVCCHEGMWHVGNSTHDGNVLLIDCCVVKIHFVYDPSGTASLSHSLVQAPCLACVLSKAVENDACVYMCAGMDTRPKDVF